MPSITLTGDQSSVTSKNRVNQSGNSLSDTNLDTETQSISLEQKIFSGFKGVNTFKTELETKKANLELKDVEQQTILDTASAYFDLIFQSKNERFNILNVNLFERQVKSDSARLQRRNYGNRFITQSELMQI